MNLSLLLRPKLSYLLAMFVFSPVQALELERIRVNDEQDGFVLAQSGAPFIPWGFNYDHDDEGALLEEYWDEDWDRVVEDFGEMKELGANVVRIHLQVHQFVESPTEANSESLRKLEDLLDLAENVGLYLDLTGLGCYHKEEVPDWFDRLEEKQRWEAQAFFWREVARICSQSPAVFCYDLMNEPVVPGGKRKAGDWLGPAFAGKHFVQFIALDRGDRERVEVAREWIATLVREIRMEDPDSLVTLGMVPWSVEGKGMTSGFDPNKIVDLLDFLCIHAYPRSDDPNRVLEQLEGFRVGKPVVIEETFPLHCSVEEFETFMESTKGKAAGWIGFYWGVKPETYRTRSGFAAAATLAWLEFFEKRGSEFKK